MPPASKRVVPEKDRAQARGHERGCSLAKMLSKAFGERDHETQRALNIRIAEGAEEIQMRRVAGYMFGFMSQRAPKGVVEEG